MGARLWLQLRGPPPPPPFPPLLHTVLGQRDAQVCNGERLFNHVYVFSFFPTAKLCVQHWVLL